MNRYLKILTLLCIIIAAAIFCTQKKVITGGTPQRIVSLAPSITETLFALGVGDKVVGVTAYCKYPHEVAKIEKIGGYSDANLEKIVSLHPDLIVATKEHSRQQNYFQQIGIPVLTVDNKSCAAICSSFALIGKKCLAVTRADSLINMFKSKTNDSWDTAKYRPKILLCVGRDNPGDGSIRSVYVAGASTVYSELINAAGGINAISDSNPEFPRLSPEGIITVNPDIIIDIASAMSNYSCELLIKDWSSIGRVSAVKTDDVNCISEGYATVPGPRLVNLIDDIRDIVSKYHEKNAQDWQ